MCELRVSAVSREPTDHGVTELRAADDLIGYTVSNDPDLMRRIEPRGGDTAVVVRVDSLARALGEAKHFGSPAGAAV